jgi:hypothetical protein
MPTEGSAARDQQNSVAGPIGGRPLTPGEVALLRSVFFDAVDYAPIRLRKGSVLTLFAGAVTMDNLVNFNPECYVEDYSTSTRDNQALLVHEVVHVWQYQQKIRDYRWSKAAVEHLRHGKSTYKYVIEPDKKLTDYRFEQMGQILQDYYRMLPTHPLRVALEAIIYRSIPRPPKPG